MESNQPIKLESKSFLMEDDCTFQPGFVKQSTLRKNGYSVTFLKYESDTSLTEKQLNRHTETILVLTVYLGILVLPWPPTVFFFWKQDT